MTSLVGIYCSDGIVIGADGVTTIANQMVQPRNKIRVLDRNPVIFAGAGNVGYIERLHGVIQVMWNSRETSNCASSIDVAKLVTSKGLTELEQTYATPTRVNTPLFTDVGGMLGFVHGSKHSLCVLEHGSLQPMLYDGNLWYCSIGNNSHITNTFLAFMRDVFWQTGPPTVAQGTFAAVWTLRHVIQTNAGGVGGDMAIATIARNPKGQFEAASLTPEAIQLHEQAVGDAKEHLRSFTERHVQLLLGESVPTIPMPEGPKDGKA